MAFVMRRMMTLRLHSCCIFWRSWGSSRSTSLLSRKLVKKMLSMNLKTWGIWILPEIRHCLTTNSWRIQFNFCNILGGWLNQYIWHPFKLNLCPFILRSENGNASLAKTLLRLCLRLRRPTFSPPALPAFARLSRTFQSRSELEIRGIIQIIL